MAHYDLASQTARYDRARVVARWDVRNRHPLTHHNHNHNNNQENTMSTTITLRGTVFTTKRDGSDALTLAYTQKGTPRLRFQVNDSHRKHVNGQWVTDDRKGRQGVSYYAVTVWGPQAEAVDKMIRDAAGSTGRADVTVTGSLSQDVWKAQDGTERTTATVNADAVGVEEPRGQQGGGQAQTQQGGQWNGPQGGGATDPWASEPNF